MRNATFFRLGRTLPERRHVELLILAELTHCLDPSSIVRTDKHVVHQTGQHWLRDLDGKHDGRTRNAALREGCRGKRVDREGIQGNMDYQANAEYGNKCWMNRRNDNTKKITAQCFTWQTAAWDTRGHIPPWI
jgi:hypothetical protein